MAKIVSLKVSIFKLVSISEQTGLGLTLCKIVRIDVQTDCSLC